MDLPRLDDSEDAPPDNGLQSDTPLARMKPAVWMSFVDDIKRPDRMANETPARLRP